MQKALNILMFLLIILFILNIYRYYSSSKNIEIKNFNRANIDEIIKKKISNLPVLANDTDNVIEFNNSLESERKSEKKRSFWELLKIK
tara:strand:+ start:393 stop:656 length:264 start_codon:yes stop_codon:yes gene_type:complete